MVTFYPSILLKKLLFPIIILYSISIKCEEECPKEYPIYNTLRQKCSLEYCTEEQFLNKTCIIANKFAKIRWINKKTVISESNTSQIYPTVALDEQENLLFETSIGKKSKTFLSLETDGNPYKPELSKYELKKTGNDNFLFNYYPKSILTMIDSHKMFFSLSSKGAFGIFDLDENNYSEKVFEEVLGYKIESNINSLLRTKDTNVYIYCYITLENRLAMQKIKFKKDDIDIIKSLIEEKKTIPRNSRKCEIFFYDNKELIECIDMDIEQNYYIRLYDSNLDFIKEFKLDKNLAPIERAYYSYNDIYYYENGINLFFTFNDIPEKGTKLIYYWKKYNGDTFTNIVESQEKYELFKDFYYYFSDVDNALAVLSDGYLMLASMTLYGNKHLLIILFDVVKTQLIGMYYVDVPLKDLYNINFFSHLYAFSFDGRIGIGFIEQINENNIIKYQSSFILFNFANSTDPEPVYNIFSTYNKINGNLYQLKTLDYINIQNNLFCYIIKGFRFIEYPNSDTGIEILITDKQNITENIKNFPDSGFADTITISYSKEINEIQKGYYEIIFIPILEEADRDTFIESLSKEEMLPYNPSDDWIPEAYEGRNIRFKFTVGNCHKNCLTCNIESDDDLNQNCIKCLSGYYFLEKTNNCYNYVPKGYFFDKEKKLYSKCHSNCATCSGVPKNDGQIHNCLTCKDQNDLLYDNTNCLKCKSLNLYADFNQIQCIPYIPTGYYLNNSELNTIDKCYEKCYACNKGYDIVNNNMNCLSCDFSSGLYFVENTNNCETSNYEGYYLDSDLKLKKCYKFCKTCKKGGSDDKMNCDSCDNKLGYFLNSSSTNCEYKVIDNFYYVPENDSYLPCYDNCQTCYDKEIIITSNNNGDNYIVMNCLSCNESEGYYLFTKNGNNCLRCKSENKYVNYEETNCIDTVPEGYYVSNNDTNQIDKCYKECKTCSEKGYSDDDMKCDSCFSQPGIFLNKGNCVKYMTCDNYFYYKSNLEQNMDINMEKKCLNYKEECPDLLPFYLTTNNECTSRCDLESIFGEGCKIGNLNKGLYQLINLIKKEYLNENYEKYFSYINTNNKINEVYIMKIKIFDYGGDIEKKITNLESNIKRLDNEEYLQIPKNSHFIEEKINNINECLQILGYISDNNYTSDNRTDIINNDKKFRILKVDINNLNTSLNKNYFKLFDVNNDYQDINISICNNLYYNKSINLEQIISQKISEINKDESDNNINKQYNSDKCKATYDDNGADLLLEDRIILNNKINIKKNNQNKTIILYPYEICPSNCEIIDFNNKTFTSNCYCLFINNYIQNNDDLSLINNNNSYDNEPYTIIIENDNNDIEETTEETNDDKVIIESNANIKYITCINSISSQFKKNYILIIMTILDIFYLLSAILYCFYYRKMYIEPLNNKKNIIIKNIKGLKSSYTYRIGGNPPPKSRDKKFKSNMFSNPNSDGQSINNNDYNNKKISINKTINKIHYINNNINNDDELTFRNNNTYNYKNNKQKKYIDYDLEEYKIVLAKDKRSCTDTFCSITKKKHIFILAFKEDDYIPVLKITLLIFCIINYFTTNVFLFTDKVIHQIYLDKGDYNSNYQIKNIFLAAFISSLFVWFSKVIFLVKKSDKNILYNLKFVDLFYFLFLLLIIFYWIYVGSYTSVFIKSQKHLSFNFLLTIVICILYEFVLSIIALIFRIIAIKKGNCPVLYKISVFLILLKG